MAAPLRILHLSDLHLGDITTRFLDHAKYSVPAEVRSIAEKAFTRAVKSLDITPVDAVVVSGDVTIAGSPSGFTEFSRFVAQRVLKDNVVHDPSQLCIVPGNHDVVWGLSGDGRYRDRFDRFSRMVDELGATTCLTPVTDDLAFSDDSNRRPLRIDRERGLLVLCMNSAIRCGEVDVGRRQWLQNALSATAAVPSSPLEATLWDLTVNDIAAVTTEQLDRLTETLQRERKASAYGWDALFKVATLHHHLVPFEYQFTEHKAFDAIADASQVLQRLHEFGFHLVLSGHKHQQYSTIHFGGEQAGATRPHRTMLIAGAPTLAGAPIGHRGFRDIEIHRQGDSFVVDIRTHEFMGDVRSSIERFIVGASHSLCDRARLHLRTGGTQQQSEPTAHPPGRHIALLNLTRVASQYDEVGALLREATAAGNPTDDVTIDGVYDLYGSWDFLVRLRARSGGDARQFLRAVLGHRYQERDCWVEPCLAGGDSDARFEGGCVFVGTDSLDDTQIRAFIRVTGKSRARWIDVFTKAVLNPGKDGQRVALAAIYVFQANQVIADCVASCGAFRELSAVLSDVEDALTESETQETLLVKQRYER